jgi:membrane protease YdiL (CAAX protease family)
MQFDWRLRNGIATPANFAVLLLVLFTFPWVLHETRALAVAAIDPADPRHTPAFLHFCFVVLGFLWTCFAICLGGILNSGRSSFQEVIGRVWNRTPDALRDLGVVLLTLVVMLLIGNLTNRLITPSQHDAALYRSMVAHNRTEALAFLALALSAGFVEEFVFRGYVQRQCEALFGNLWLASIVQIALFTQGHLYQGVTRLLPVLLIGTLLTAVALWRKSLIPGIIAHGWGDSLVALTFFLK